MDKFEANPMRGTSFNIDDDDEDTTFSQFMRDKSIRPASEIEDMIQQVTKRMGEYKSLYEQGKRNRNRDAQIESLRNYKALEGVRQALRWVLIYPDVDQPLY
tara:strand:+ start:10997 stop:11302 length:306 start_codon:yes stop_codon:yes gene_type:complete